MPDGHPDLPRRPGEEGLRGSLTRRRLLGLTAGATGGLLLSRFVSPAFGQERVPDPMLGQGAALSGMGSRSPFVTLAREVGNPDATQDTAGWTLTPLQDLEGVITPSDLHFERHHAGVAIVDPVEHRLVVHGMVDRPKSYTLWDLERFPRESHIYFIECSGNSLDAWGGGDPDDTAQTLHGLVSTSEWVGVPLRTIMEDVGADPASTWALFEGADAARMTRSVPVEKLMDDALIAFVQNGEPIRPEQGYPMRLVLPGWEGNAQIKWLRRIEFGDGPFYTKEETRHYTDPLPDGRSRQFTFVMEAKGLITWPSAGRGVAGSGRWQISGLAWSGRGSVERVEVSTDGGESWTDAEIAGPVLPFAPVRFRLPWDWDGQETVLMSRTVDDTGYVQPTRQDLLEARGEDSVYHYNGIQPWRVHADGRVTNGYAEEEA